MKDQALAAASRMRAEADYHRDERVRALSELGRIMRVAQEEGATIKELMGVTGLSRRRIFQLLSAEAE